MLVRMCSLAWILASLSACCTIGPNDHPGGVIQYFKDCRDVIEGR